jgi:SulP family sulfate permease
MTTKHTKSAGWGLPMLQGVLPIKPSQVPAEIIAGLTLAALAIPEVMGYTKISGTPVITGLYTILIPMALFAMVGSSRHLVVGADSATAAILAAGLVELASVGSDEYVASAAVLAFMAAGFLILAQSAATSRAYAARYNERFSEDTDLVGLAAANIGAGLSGTFVVNGSPTKTQMVDSAGGRTQLSLLVTTAIVLVALLFLTAPLAYMPEAVLSAVVFLIGVDLIDIAGMKKIYRERRSEYWVALITTLMVILVGVEQGIILAIVLSLIDHTRRGYRPKNALLSPTESGVMKPQPVASGVQSLPGLVIYRFTHSMYYANAEQLFEEITQLAKSADPPLRWLCLDASAVDDVDFSAAETLRSLFGVLKDKGIRLVVAQVMEDVREESRYQLDQLFGKDAFYETLDDMLNAYRRETGE